MATVSGDPSPSNTFQSRPLSQLLKLAGFRVRGRRADCSRCDGHSRLTVAFNDEVAFCHRCKWTGNLRTVSRELGLPLAPESSEARERRARAAQFDEWTAACHTILTRQLRSLERRAELAKKILAQFPDSEAAWEALAELYHNEAGIIAALDMLSFEKLSPWLEVPMTRDNLFAAFEAACERTGSAAHAA